MQELTGLHKRWYHKGLFYFLM